MFGGRKSLEMIFLPLPASADNKMLAGIEEGFGEPGSHSPRCLPHLDDGSLVDGAANSGRGCRCPLQADQIDCLFGGEFQRQKKGSSFGITAAASRGVFYELPVGRGKSANGFTCASSSARAGIGLPTGPFFDAWGPRWRALPIALDRPASSSSVLTLRWAMRRCASTERRGVPCAHFGARPSKLATVRVLTLSLFLLL